MVAEQDSASCGLRLAFTVALVHMILAYNVLVLVTLSRIRCM